MNINTMQESAINRAVALLLKQQQEELPFAEQQELEMWLAQSPENRRFADRCLDKDQLAASLAGVDKTDDEAAWQRFVEKVSLEQKAPVVPIHRRPWRWIAAAVVLATVATATFLWLKIDRHKRAEEVVVVKVNKGENILPATNKATLTLGDGRVVTLDDAQNGVLAKEGRTAVKKTGDLLEYQADGATDKNRDKSAAAVYNTVKTPRGASLALTLADKTKVWLNAEASIRMPTAFAGKERRVEITGEAYFEVTKDPSKPFIVSAGDAQINVLGTHFNIRNYAGEDAIRTTLLEGSVEVAMGQGKKVILKPNQQAIIATGDIKSATIPIRTVDVSEVVAWKNGYFEFRSTPLKDIMQEIRRWYNDVEIEATKAPLDEQFTASVSRHVSLSTMLTILEATGRVHFEVNNKTIIVTK